jgi:hypothetical protein
MASWGDEPGDRQFKTDRPATHISWIDTRWPTCWICRALGRWPLWNARDRHIDKRHPEAPTIYTDGPYG